MVDTTPLPINPNGGSIQGTYRTITNGTRKTVPTPGTAVALVSTSTLCKFLIVQALFTNTKPIAVGDLNAKATAGSESGSLLEAGASITIPIVDVSLIFIDALIANEGAVFTYFV